MAELADGLAMKLCIGNRAILKPNLILPVAFCDFLALPSANKAQTSFDLWPGEWWDEKRGIGFGGAKKSFEILLLHSTIQFHHAFQCSSYFRNSMILNKDDMLASFLLSTRMPPTSFKRSLGKKTNPDIKARNLFWTSHWPLRKKTGGRGRKKTSGGEPKVKVSCWNKIPGAHSPQPETKTMGRFCFELFNFF